MDSKFNIICFSNQLWDYPNWTNKRHVMYRLGKMGYKIIFVDPPINFGKVLLTQFKKKFFNFFRLLLGYKIEENVLVYTPIKFFPSEKFFAKFFSNKINKLAQKHLNPDLKTVMWVYNVEIPELDIYLTEVTRDFLLYDCVDYYAGFPRYETKDQKERILEIEKNLSKNSDLIFATAPGLVERLKKYNSKAFYTPNVGDFELFHNIKQKFSNQIPLKLENIKHPIIGYIGALDTYKFNYQLLKESALTYPDYSFVIIGDIALKDREGSLKELGLDNIPNIYFLGSVPFIETPQYMAHFDVELIPYVYNDYTVGGCFPVKFFNTMSAGIPSVVTDLPVFSLYKDITYISKTNDDFIENIKKALEENSSSKISDRVSIAKLNTWDLKVSSMSGILKSHLGKL
jgi:glycosyltransferase involved in cell wall biosynthesis